MSDFSSTAARRPPENYNALIQLVDSLHEIPNIPHDQAPLEDEVKKLVNQQDLQDKIDQLRDELTRLVEDHGDAIQYKLMTEIQRLGDVLLQARKKSLLEVIATSSGIMTLVGTAIDLSTATPAGTVLSSIMQTASEIRSSARNKLDERLQSYLDDLNIRMPKVSSILDRPVATSKLTE